MKSTNAADASTQAVLPVSNETSWSETSGSLAKEGFRSVPSLFRRREHPAAPNGHPVCDNGGVGVRSDCRHYSTRSTNVGDVLERCRLDAAETLPFACPADCLFFEPRAISDAGWTVTGDEPPGRGIERDL